MLTNRQKTERAEKEAFWKPHLTAIESSGLSVKAYCEAHKLMPHQLYYWQEQLSGKKEIAANKSKSTHPTFIEVKQHPGDKPAVRPFHCKLDIKTSQGFAMNLNGPIEPNKLTAFIELIKGIA